MSSESQVPYTDVTQMHMYMYDNFGKQ